MIFSDRLRGLAKASGLDDKRIADAVGVSVGAMHNYLHGRVPKAEELLRLAQYFGVSMEFLLTGESSGQQQRGALVFHEREQGAISEALEEIRAIQNRLAGVQRSLETMRKIPLGALEQDEASSSTEALLNEIVEEKLEQVKAKQPQQRRGPRGPGGQPGKPSHSPGTASDQE